VKPYHRSVSPCARVIGFFQQCVIVGFCALECCLCGFCLLLRCQCPLARFRQFSGSSLCGHRCKCCGLRSLLRIQKQRNACMSRHNSKLQSSNEKRLLAMRLLLTHSPNGPCLFVVLSPSLVQFLCFIFGQYLRSSLSTLFTSHHFPFLLTPQIPIPDRLFPYQTNQPFSYLVLARCQCSFVRSEPTRGLKQALARCLCFHPLPSDLHNLAR